MKLEVGKFYRRADDIKCQCVFLFCDQAVLVAESTGDVWRVPDNTENGTPSLLSERIVSEWKEPQLNHTIERMKAWAHWKRLEIQRNDNHPNLNRDSDKLFLADIELLIETAISG